MNANKKSSPMQTEREAADKMEFDGGFMNVLKTQLQADVLLKAGDQTEGIPAHKFFLMARSKVFRNLLESDDLKVSLSIETVTLSEMKHDELETFLEFIYKGSISDTKMTQHVRVLYVAADKYEIPHLQDLCRIQLSGSLNIRNVFDVLDLAKVHSDKILQNTVFEFITSNMEEISSSIKFMSFVKSNPALTVQAIRGHVSQLKRKRLEKKRKRSSSVEVQRATGTGSKVPN